MTDFPNHLSIPAIERIAGNQKIKTINMAYDGQVTTKSIESILDLISQALIDAGIKTHLGKSLRIAVEVLQNISKHSLQADNNKATILLYQTSEGIMLAASNRISSPDRKRIEDIFEAISVIPESEYKSYFRKALSNSCLSEKGGAGIGLLDIVYRSGKIPFYHFNQLGSSDDSIFLIQTKLN
jgi:hypothetical protein